MSGRFEFLEVEQLAQGELELVAPHERYVDEVLAACRHPLTEQQMPREASTTRQQLLEMLQAWPMGHQPGDKLRGLVPAYHFWMRVGRQSVGGIGLRIGSTRDIEMYYGHIGYHVFPAARGHHYAERACRLVLPIARQHGLAAVWITCNPDNWASRRTCERLGGVMVEIVDVPSNNPLYLRGETRKCRYRVDL